MMQKTFFAEDMRKALRLVRDSMGAEAVILANKKVPGGVEVAAAITSESASNVKPVKVSAKKYRANANNESKKVVSNTDAVSAKGVMKGVESKAQRVLQSEQQLQAAVGDNTTAVQENSDMTASTSVSAYDYYNANSLSQDSDKTSLENTSGSVAHPADLSTENAMPDNTISRNHDVLDEIKKHYEKELTQVREQLGDLQDALEKSRAVADPLWQKIKEKLKYKLKDMGFSNPACERITNKAHLAESEASSWKNAMDCLASEIVCRKDDFEARYGCYCFIGSPGVGKTTLITKLAIEHIQKYGRDDLILLTLDNQRLGASQQIMQLGQLLQVPVFTGDKAERLISKMEQAGRNKKVLVDTAGVTAAEDYWLEQVHLLKKLPESSKTYLVLSCTQQLAVLSAMVHDYLLLDICGAVLTKVDEATSIVEGLSIVLENDLPVCAIGHSQKTSQPLLKVSESELIEMMLNKSRRWNAINDIPATAHYPASITVGSGEEKHAAEDEMQDDQQEQSFDICVD